MELRLLYVQYLAHDDHQNFNFLFRLRYVFGFADVDGFLLLARINLDR
jgi:hypothetical protein